MVLCLALLHLPVDPGPLAYAGSICRSFSIGTMSHRMSKIEVTRERPTQDDLMDPRFGRVADFLLVDLESMETLLLSGRLSCGQGQNKER